MTFSLAVRTVPQRGMLFNTLMQRLLKFHRHPNVKGLHVSNRTDVTPNENGCLALEAAIVDGTDWIIFLEDDAGPIADFLGSTTRWLADHEDPNIHVYPLGCQYAEAWPKTGEPTSWKYYIKDYYCSVAFVLRAAYAESLVSYFRTRNFARQGFDIFTGRWHQTVSDSPYLLTPIPCFVEHLGDESTLVDGRPDRNVVGRFRGFRGFDYTYQGRNGHGR